MHDAMRVASRDPNRWSPSSSSRMSKVVYRLFTSYFDSEPRHHASTREGPDNTSSAVQRSRLGTSLAVTMEHHAADDGSHRAADHHRHSDRRSRPEGEWIAERACTRELQRQWNHAGSEDEPSQRHPQASGPTVARAAPALGVQDRVGFVRLPLLGDLGRWCRYFPAGRLLDGGPRRSRKEGQPCEEQEMRLRNLRVQSSSGHVTR